MPKDQDGLKCQNCGFKTNDLIQRNRGDRLLCSICIASIPGLYVVGATGDAPFTLEAVVMRQISFCTNTILEAVREKKTE